MVSLSLGVGVSSVEVPKTLLSVADPVLSGNIELLIKVGKEFFTWASLILDEIILLEIITTIPTIKKKKTTRVTKYL